MIRWVAIAALFSPAVSFGLNVGDRAPEIFLDKLLPEQPVSNVRLDALAGKVVVLELWATWCAPCVESIPHMNELTAQFKGRPVVFLSVTDEAPGVVESFLKTHPINGLVGIAHERSPVGVYGAETVPVAFLIDRTGKIAGSIDPEALKASMLDSLLAGDPLPTVDLSIGPAAGSGLSSESGWNRERLNGVTIGFIVSHLWGVPQSRVIGDGLTRDAYDVRIAIPGASRANFRLLERDAIAQALHIKVIREVRDRDVWVLSKTDALPVVLQAAGTIAGSEGFGWFPEERVLTLANSDVSLIAQFVEIAVKRPVVDETGLSGRYDIRVNAAADGLVNALRSGGFKIEPARRAIDYLVVER
jgi:uncharacterized protein (TIGR03435 family)